MYIYINVCLCIYIYITDVCVCVCVCVYIYIYIYMHIGSTRHYLANRNRAAWRVYIDECIHLDRHQNDR